MSDYVKGLEKRLEELQEENAKISKWKPDWKRVSDIEYIYTTPICSYGSVNLQKDSGFKKVVYIARAINNPQFVRCQTLDQAKAKVESLVAETFTS